MGDRVIWGFASVGHNVSCRTEDGDAVRLPAGADPFASYGPDGSPQGSFVPRGGTYALAIEVAGTYESVSIPHVSGGMRGTTHVV